MDYSRRAWNNQGESRMRYLSHSGQHGGPGITWPAVLLAGSLFKDSRGELTRLKRSEGTLGSPEAFQQGQFSEMISGMAQTRR